MNQVLIDNLQTVDLIALLLIMNQVLIDNLQTVDLIALLLMHLIHTQGMHR